MSFPAPHSGAAVHDGPAGRSRFHLRLPELPEAGGDADSKPATNEIPQGMKILNQIAARRPRQSWRNRLWMTAVALISLACLCLAIGLNRDTSDPFHVSDPDVMLDEGGSAFDTDPTPVVQHAAHPVPDAELGAHAPQHLTEFDTAIRPASFPSPESVEPRGAWLDGTIITDEADEP